MSGIEVELVKGRVSPYRPWGWYEMSGKYVNKKFPFRWIVNLDLKVNGKKYNLYKDTKNIEITFPHGSFGFIGALSEEKK